MEIKISDIKIGNRFREDLGDINELADSIKKQGLLQPVGIDENNNLIFGQRRIEACKRLRQDFIEARIVNVTSIIEGELTENEMRKEFTIAERVAITNKVEEIEKVRAKERQKRKPKSVVENFPQQKSGEKSRDIAARKTGFGSGKTYEKAKHVVEHATPEVIEKLDKPKLQGGISIDKAYNDIKREERRKEKAESLQKNKIY